MDKLEKEMENTINLLNELKNQNLKKDLIKGLIDNLRQANNVIKILIIIPENENKSKREVQ